MAPSGGWSTTIGTRDYNIFRGANSCRFTSLHGSEAFPVNTGSGNGLVSDGTKPLPDPILSDISKTLRIPFSAMFVIMNDANVASGAMKLHGMIRPNTWAHFY